MAHRVFQDVTGREWLVWDVIPQAADRRDGAASRGLDERFGGRAEAGDRRAEPQPESARTHAHLPLALASGWLCFESGDEKRRLGPIPRGWESLSDTELGQMLRQAQRTTPRDAQLDTTKLRAMARPGMRDG